MFPSRSRSREPATYVRDEGIHHLRKLRRKRTLEILQTLGRTWSNGQTHHTLSYTSQVIQWRSDAERKNINWTSVEHWWFGKSIYNYVSIYIPSISNSCRVFKYRCDHPSVSTVKTPQRRSQHSWHVCWGLGAAQPWREARSRHSMSQLGAQHVEVQDQHGLQSMLQEALHGVHVILQTSPVVWRGFTI